MTRFCDLPDEWRMRLREGIELLGGVIEAYEVDGTILVAIPCPGAPFLVGVKQIGWELVTNTLHYFPLGSDASFVPANMRHNGSYPDSKGFWLYGTLALPSAKAALDALKEGVR